MHTNLAVVGFFTVMDIQLTVDDLQTVTQELLPVAERWKAIGRALQLDMTKFEDEMQQPHLGSRTDKSAENYLLEMLREWLKCPNGQPTWHSIVDALQSSAVGEMKLALLLESKYCIAAPWKPEDTGSSSS